MNLDKVQCIMIIGDRNTGKTNLLFQLAQDYKGTREIILYGYPKEIINPKTGKPFRRIYTQEQLQLEQDKIMFIDEIHKHFKFYNKQTSEEFMDNQSTLVHNGNTIVGTTQLSQYLTKPIEGYIDGYLYTRIQDVKGLKNGSKCKRYLDGFSLPGVITRRVLNLKQGQYIQIVEGQSDTNGMHEFPFQGIGKDWRQDIPSSDSVRMEMRPVATKKATKPATVSAKTWKKLESGEDLV